MFLLRYAENTSFTYFIYSFSVAERAFVIRFWFFRRKTSSFPITLRSYYEGDLSAMALETLDDSKYFTSVNLDVPLVKLRSLRIRFILLRVMQRLPVIRDRVTGPLGINPRQFHWGPKSVIPRASVV